MKRKIIQSLTIGVVSLLAVTIPIATFAWFDLASTTTKDKTIKGEVGLRTYFYAGDGSLDEPYEIVYPEHFYNFSRLQNLGVFSGETYFQIGHKFDGVNPECVMDHDDNNSKPYLDLKSICYGERPLQILPIGSEGTPFVGHFFGNGVPIRNLKISGYPDDIGVFGYVDFKGTIDGLVLDGTYDGVNDFGVEICSLGYNKTGGEKDNMLFSADIDDIFESAYYFSDARLSISKYLYQTWQGGEDPEWGWTELSSLKDANGSLKTSLQRLNGYDSYEGIEPSFNRTGDKYNKAYFKVQTPEKSSSRPFDYKAISSSVLLQNEKESRFDINDDDVLDENIYFIDMKALKDSTDFTSGPRTAEARLAIVATTEVDGYKFSRVIQSYVVEFYSNGDHYAKDPVLDPDPNYNGSFFANVYLDYSTPQALDNPEEIDYVTNYHHGNNIGVLVGHLNGTITNSYAYNPRLTFNKSDMNPILTETDTGLVGEIGKNVINSIDPDLGLTTDGSIGVMNLTRIYESIRRDATLDSGHTLRGARISTSPGVFVNYMSYKDFINVANYNTLWKDYLRMDNEAGDDPHQPILSTNIDMKNGYYTIAEQADIDGKDINKVDFIWNKAIENEENKNREMGVFKVITSRCELPNDYDPEDDYGNYMLKGIGESTIVDDKSAQGTKTEVFFSTAEYDHTVSNTYGWGGASAEGPLRGIDLPNEYAKDLSSFDYPFSRDHNYCFRLDLSEMDIAGSNYYMSNTTNSFLKSYLSTKLINDRGIPITSGPNFGFMFAKKGTNAIERPKKFTAYMPVKKPIFSEKVGNVEVSRKFQPDGSDKWYPANCIAFSILNSFGGNVSIIGNNADISIYSVDTENQAYNPEKDKQLYSMRSSNFSGTNDRHRYFDFHVSNGTVDPVNLNDHMDTDNHALYAHIFKLPPGDYVVGAKNNNETAHVYFLAVQGQEKGELDSVEYADMGNRIENVDFLTERPTYENYKIYIPSTNNYLKRAWTSFSANFNENEDQTFYIKTQTYETIQALWLDFADGATSFVTYLVTYSPSPNTSPIYIQDHETPYIQESVAYRSPGTSEGG